MSSHRARLMLHSTVQLCGRLRCGLVVLGQAVTACCLVCLDATALRNCPRTVLTACAVLCCDLMLVVYGYLTLLRRWFSSALGATSESFADSLERFCAAAPKNLLLTQDSSAAAAGVAATLAALQQAPADAGANGSSKKLRKRQAQLTHELVQKQLVAAESTVAQVDAQGASVHV